MCNNHHLVHSKRMESAIIETVRWWLRQKSNIAEKVKQLKQFIQQIGCCQLKNSYIIVEWNQNWQCNNRVAHWKIANKNGDDVMRDKLNVVWELKLTRIEWYHCNKSHVAAANRLSNRKNSLNRRVLKTIDKSNEIQFHINPYILIEFHICINRKNEKWHATLC